MLVTCDAMPVLRIRKSPSPPLGKPSSWPVAPRVSVANSAESPSSEIGVPSGKSSARMTESGVAESTKRGSRASMEAGRFCED